MILSVEEYGFLDAITPSIIPKAVAIAKLKPIKMSVAGIRSTISTNTGCLNTNESPKSPFKIFLRLRYNSHIMMSIIEFIFW